LSIQNQPARSKISQQVKSLVTAHLTCCLIFDRADWFWLPVLKSTQRLV